MKKIFTSSLLILLFIFISIQSSEENVNQTQASFEKLKRDVINCESGGRHIIWGDCDKKMPRPHYCLTFSCAKKYHCKAYGICQFWKKTFDNFNSDFGSPEWKRESRDNQLALFDLALRRGKGHNWTCYRNLFN